MINNIVINLEENNKSNTIELLEDIDEEGKYNIRLSTNVNESLTTILESQRNQKLFLRNTIKSYCDNPEIIEYLKSNTIKDIVASCPNINFSGNFASIRAYLDKNPSLKNKNITIDNVQLDDQSLKEAKYYFKDMPNVRFYIEGNLKSISLSTYEKTVNAINEIVDKIKSHNFSPYESLLYAYDLIRDKFYKEEDIDEDFTVSRDLSSALLGDKIVCLGFARIFHTVVTKLGLNSLIFILKLKDGVKHARNLIYLNDEKYDIDGLYFFDATFDSKKSEDNEFLRGYSFFGKTKEEMDELSGYNFIYETYNLFSIDDIAALEDELQNDIVSYDDKLLKINISKVNHILRLVGKRKLSLTETYTKDEIIAILEDILDLAEQPIGAETFLKALYTVRKQEYYENPSKYVFDAQVLIDILLGSRFRNTVSDGQDLLFALYGLQKLVDRNEASDLVDNYLNENDGYRDMERVHLAKTLRKVLEKKINR